MRYSDIAFHIANAEMTALHYCVLHNRFDILSALLASNRVNCNPQIKFKTFRRQCEPLHMASTLQLAAALGTRRTLTLLLEHFPVDSNNDDDDEEDDDEEEEDEEEEGEEDDEEEDDDSEEEETLLHSAVLYTNEECVRFLLDDPRFRSIVHKASRRTHFAPLFEAIDGADSRIVNIFLANEHATDGMLTKLSMNKETLLSFALRKLSFPKGQSVIELRRIVRRLLEFDWPQNMVNSRNYYGMTALHHTCRCRDMRRERKNGETFPSSLDVVARLLELSADVTIECINGKTALEHANETGWATRTLWNYWKATLRPVRGADDKNIVELQGKDTVAEFRHVMSERFLDLS